MRNALTTVLLSVTSFIFAAGGAFAGDVSVWVSPTGSATAPYDTAATGFTTLTDALTYLREQDAASAFTEAAVVKLDTGTYSDYNHKLDFPVEIRSEGRTVTFKGDCRFFVLNHAQAVLDGVKITGTTNMGDNKTALTVTKGIARNCTFSGWSSANGPIVTVNGGRLESSFFGDMWGYGAWSASGVCVTSDGVVSNCVFNGTRRMETCWYVNGGTIQHSTMTNCQTSAHGHLNLANNLVYMRAGVIENCIICRNGYTDMYQGDGYSGYGIGSTAFGAVSVHGGTLRNCLIYGNTAKQYPGVGLLGGKMVNCTIGTHKSVSSSATGVGLDLYLKAGAVVNSAVCGNPTASDAGVMLVSGCTAVATNSAFAEGVTVSGYGNMTMSKSDFVDAANNDYRLAKSTGLRDTCGIEYDVFTESSVDLGGNIRIQNEKMEPGCYELAPLGDDDVVMRVDLVSSTLNDDYSSDKTYEIVLTGPKTTGFSYDWRMDDVTVGTETRLTKTFTPGLWTLRAIATRGKLSLTNDIAISVLNRTIYVSPKGSNMAPYDSWERALTDFNGIADVLAEGGTAFHEVLVSNATYSVTKNQTFSRNCHIRGYDDRATLTISGGAITIDGEQTEFSHFWIKNSCNNMQVTKGHAHDIEMSNKDLSGAPALKVNGGHVSRLYSHDFSGGYSYTQVPVLISAGLLDDFVIENCTGCESGIIVTGGTVSNGVVRGLTADSNLAYHLYQNAISVRGGLVTHCVATNSGTKSYSHHGAVDMRGGTLRNCLIAGNRASECAGICMIGESSYDSGSERVVENCTVIVNEGDVEHIVKDKSSAQYGQVSTYGSCLHMPKGTVRNCVFYTRETKEDDKYYIRVTGGTMSNCWVNPGGLDPEIAGTKILVGTDPGFKSVGQWDYIPAGNSPLNGAGRNLPWMTGAKDLAGEDRIRGRRVDIGAFEGIPRGLLLLVR